MRNLLAFFAAVVLTIGGVGYYLGWYHVTTTPTANGKKTVSVEVDTNKIGEDLSKGAEKVKHQLAEKARGEAGAEKKALDIPSPPPAVQDVIIE